MSFLPAKKSKAYEGPECPRCAKTLVPAGLNGTTRCAACGCVFEALSFAPIALADRGPVRMGSSGPDGALPCAWHAGNVAEAACARCGTFICGLCRVDIEKRTLCTNCYERQASEGALASTVLTTRDWTTSARISALGGFFLIPFLIGPLLGVAAVYYSIRGRRAKKAANEENEIGILTWTLVAGLLDIVLGASYWTALIAAATK